MTGRFITLEGGEGVGKTTQAMRVAEALRERGLAVVTTREPGGSAGAEAVRALLLGGEAERWTPEAEALLFAAARADHVARTIAPALAQGQWVLCDRFIDSTLAYQGAADGIVEEQLRLLHRFASGGLMPDRTLLFALPSVEANVRAAERDHAGADRFGAREAAYHARVAQAFERLSDAEPQRIRRIDARGSPAEVTARALEALADLW